MREIMLAELRHREFHAEAARFRLAPEACRSDVNGPDIVEAIRRSLRTMLARAQDALDAIEWALFSMRRSARSH